MALRPRRSFGSITNDLEVILLEMTEEHELQWGEILNIVRGYLEVHCPDAREEYTEDRTHPVFYYGPLKEKNDEKTKN